MLAIIDTHPIQYRAPVYRSLQKQFGIPLTVVYGSDFSIKGYKDQEFGTTFAWDIDLLSGYNSIFLSQVSQGGALCFDDVSAKGLSQTLDRLKPKAILLTGYQHRLYKSAIFKSWKSRYPILFRAETTDHARSRNSFKRCIRDMSLQLLYHNCQKLLYIGQRSKQHFQRLSCPEEKLIRSPYCIDPSPFQLNDIDHTTCRRTTRQKFGISDSQVVLLFSGKLSDRKRPDLILKAAKHLPSKIRDRIIVMFLGNGELAESLNQEAACEPSIKTHFLGFQNQTALSCYYHTADLLILPSQHSETWGLVVNEALHHGLPAIVSDAVGCAPDLIIPGETGAVFEVNSAESLAQAIMGFISLFNRIDVHQNCRNHVSKYSVEKAAAGITQAYQEVLQKRGKKE
ncbi:glycosyltransferase family 4 protein [Moorena sp. SIO4A5]|uniref:glycosyltransferase family 4 protein n=1 Tax=Moorena sp. SIO4A5 TaxID=2607838 RepID=UPI0013C883DE|nr:glycosyltransferase family 4 protein [Moorena sp. SIO4A5]NEO21435.1 glycosyltransferase [Moorena sp. SIO4A5]